MKKAKIFISTLLLLALVIITSLSVFMPRHLKSTDLTEQRHESENVLRIDYVDASGRITFASDKGYATRVEKREYESDVFQPDATSQGTQGDESKTNDDGEWESAASRRLVRSVITFLDESGSPVVLSAGYDEIRRTYNSVGKADTDTYYLNGKQVARKQGYYQYARSYNTDGKVSVIRYLDRDGKSVDTTAGYAEIWRTYGEHFHTDMYFDATGKPAQASLGQYGQKVEKVDGVTTTTYLDADGNPMDTEKGFAVVKKEGSKTLYYDKNGNPVTIGRGQYGVEKDEDGQSIYLDEAGNPMFRLDNFLNTHPILVLLLGVLVTAIAVLLKGKWRIAFIILYILFIGIMTVAYRETGDPHGQFVVFDSFCKFLSNANTRQNILNNIWLFVPLGAALYSEKRKCLWLVPVLLSILIETIQYFTGIGLCEIDDVITNGMGGVIGYIISWSICYLRGNEHRRLLWLMSDKGKEDGL